MSTRRHREETNRKDNLECGPSSDGLQLLRLDLARGVAGEKVPAQESGSP